MCEVGFVFLSHIITDLRNDLLSFSPLVSVFALLNAISVVKSFVLSYFEGGRAVIYGQTERTNLSLVHSYKRTNWLLSEEPCMEGCVFND